MELGYVTVFTARFEEEVDFYERVLGLPVRQRSPDFVMFDAGACALAVHRGRNASARGVNLHLRVEDVDAAYARLRERGLRFEHGPEDQPWGLRTASLRDPAGLRVELYAPVAR